MKMNIDFLTIENFKAWLGKKEDSEVVGQAQEEFCCPIANFVADYSRCGCSTGDGMLFFVGLETEFSLPEWAAQYQYHIDWKHPFPNNKITKQQALKALEEIEEEMKIPEATL